MTVRKERVQATVERRYIEMQLESFIISVVMAVILGVALGRL